MFGEPGEETAAVRVGGASECSVSASGDCSVSASDRWEGGGGKVFLQPESRFYGSVMFSPILGSIIVARGSACVTGSACRVRRLFSLGFCGVCGTVQVGQFFLL